MVGEPSNTSSVGGDVYSLARGVFANLNLEGLYNNTTLFSSACSSM